MICSRIRLCSALFCRNIWKSKSQLFIWSPGHSSVGVGVTLVWWSSGWKHLTGASDDCFGGAVMTHNGVSAKRPQPPHQLFAGERVTSLGPCAFVSTPSSPPIKESSHIAYCFCTFSDRVVDDGFRAPNRNRNHSASLRSTPPPLLPLLLLSFLFLCRQKKKNTRDVTP